ncbi:MAG TPA: hypothetical protein EYQ69_02850 [Gemmatimonadetes bacterium]|nr:hypothetical protein [Gemmatimonadota bacterium]
MTRHRPRAVLLLLLQLHLTACATWQAVTPTPMSVSQLIEGDRPERVRVTTLLAQWELVDPSVKGDEVVGHVDESSFLCRVFFSGYYEPRNEDACERFVARSVPLADIVTLETRKGETAERVLMGVGVVAGFVLATMGVLNIKSHTIN